VVTTTASTPKRAASGANASAIITVEPLEFVTMKPRPERALSKRQMVRVDLGHEQRHGVVHAVDDELLITGYPAWRTASRSSRDVGRQAREHQVAREGRSEPGR